MANIGTMAAAAVSPANKPQRHPLDAFRRQWLGLKICERESFDVSVYRDETLAFLDTLGNLGCCRDIVNPRNSIECYCMSNLDLTEEEAEQTVDYLINYFKLTFSEQRSLILEWKRYAKTLSEMHHGESFSYSQYQIFLLPGSSTHRLCRNAVATLVGKSRHAWTSIGLEGKEAHGLLNQKSNNTMSEDMKEKLNEYFFFCFKVCTSESNKAGEEFGWWG